MAELADMNCVSVEKGAVPLLEKQIKEYHQKIPGWELVTIDGEPRLTREFKFKNFSQALNFTVDVGREADAQNHHPALLTEWGKVTVSWWTHKVHGLHLNDFIMADKTNRIYTGEQK